MKSVARVLGGYDKGRQKFENATRYPVVLLSKARTGEAVDEEFLIYSSEPPDLKKYFSRKKATYHCIPGPQKSSAYYIDETLRTNNDTFSAVLAAVALTNPNANCYFTTTFEGNLSGASLGLSTTLAILGAPPVVCTGYVCPFGVQFDADNIQPIDHVEKKIELLRQKGNVLMIPENNIQNVVKHGSAKLSRIYANGGIYTFEHFLKGLNAWDGDFYAIAVSNVAEALLIAQTYKY